ncbi:MAG: transposase [Bacteroidetes bacterium]|nr:transposase [Bacteroidota bacterium]
MSFLKKDKQDLHQPLFPECYYHVYNRGNNLDKLFYKPENYYYFFEKIEKYISDYLMFYAYCLHPNHFHFIVKPKNIDGISEILSEQFRRLFLSYSKAINKQENRSGSLFQKHFKRKLIKDQYYFMNSIFYVHANPTHHKITQDFTKYPYSSYSLYVNEKVGDKGDMTSANWRMSYLLKKEEVLEMFGGIENFIAFHKRDIDRLLDDEYVLD